MHLRPHLTIFTALVLVGCTSNDTPGPSLIVDSLTEEALTSAGGAPITTTAQNRFCLDILCIVSRSVYTRLNMHRYVRFPPPKHHTWT
jgi:hypothetical protein